jgi:hypothetical protein
MVVLAQLAAMYEAIIGRGSKKAFEMAAAPPPPPPHPPQSRK